MVEVDESPHQQDNSSSGTQDHRDADRDNDERRGDIDVEAKRLLLENGNVKTKSASAKGAKKGKKSEKDRMMTEDINKFLHDMPMTEDISCGFWIFKGSFFQKFANQTAYVVVYGLVGCIFSMTFAYFNGTITTIEKRFKIPSRNTGIISVGYDISQMLISGILSYYGGKGHRPRWIGVGLLTLVAFCVLTAAPHFLYGPGEDALALTLELGAMPDGNTTMTVFEEQRSKSLCKLKGGGAECEVDEGNLTPQILLFAAQFMAGIGGSMYYTLGVSYMDDNTKRSRTPALLSLSYFLRMLGPAIGYTLASFCLRLYIAPQLNPVISNDDPRWLGAWWMGWLVLGGMLFFSALFLTMFPKKLPRAVARRMVEEERRIQLTSIKDKDSSRAEKLVVELKLQESVEEAKASFKDMWKTLKRLTSNKTLMYNNFSSIFYFFGYTPYWIFTPKYIEIQYLQSAATSSLVTGTVAVAFSAIGVLMAGFIISKFKPSARYMAAWNVIVGFLTVAGILAYAFIGCPGNESSMIVNIHDSSVVTAPTCNSECHCDYVRFSPVCGENNMTYISPCHAGCKKQHIGSNNNEIFYDCSCIPNGNVSDVDDTTIFDSLSAKSDDFDFDMKNDSFWDELPTAASSVYPDVLIGGQAIPGACPVNCYAQFVAFLTVMCFMKFLGASGRASNFLVSVRCVPEKDKTAGIGVGLMMNSMLAFIPSPIFFGWVIDRTCLVWGKTCTNKGNCWLYDAESLRYLLNITAAVFIAIGSVFDCGVWYYVKDLKIFDEEMTEIEMEIVRQEENVDSENKTKI